MVVLSPMRNVTSMISIEPSFLWISLSFLAISTDLGLEEYYRNNFKEKLILRKAGDERRWPYYPPPLLPQRTEKWKMNVIECPLSFLECHPRALPSRIEREQVKYLWISLSFLWIIDLSTNLVVESATSVVFRYTGCGGGIIDRKSGRVLTKWVYLHWWLA